MLSLMDTKVSLIVKVLWKQISFLCFRVWLEVCVHKNPTCFSRWSVSEEMDKEFLEWISADDERTYYPEFFRTELAEPVDYVKHFVTKEGGF